MSTSTLITGNLTRDPELKYSKKGTAWLSFSLAVTKKKNKDDEGHTSYFDIKLFGEDAENFADTATKGDRVMVAGDLTQDSWEDKEGNDRKSVAIMGREVGVSLKYATAEVSKRKKKSREESSDRPRKSKKDSGRPFDDDDDDF